MIKTQRMTELEYATACKRYSLLRRQRRFKEAAALLERIRRAVRIELAHD